MGSQGDPQMTIRNTSHLGVWVFHSEDREPEDREL